MYEVLVQILCLGYFIFDTMFCLWWCVYGKETNIYIIHHAVSIMGMMTSLYQGFCGKEVNVAIFLAEVTNPLLQFRWFMRELGSGRGDVLYELNDFVFIATYLCMRLGLSPYLAYLKILHPQQPNDLLKFLGVVFCVMNVILSVGVIQFAYRKYSRMYIGWKLDNLKRAGNRKNGLINNSTFALDHDD